MLLLSLRLRVRDLQPSAAICFGSLVRRNVTGFSGSSPDLIPFRNNKVALITGASSGIGAATAVHFAYLGYSLSLTGKNVTTDELGLAETAAQCRKTNTELGEENILTTTGDLTVESDCRKAIEKTLKKFNRIDVLVNNAGIVAMNPLETMSMDEFDRVMDINVRSVVLLMKLTVPHLIESQGNIVNVSSVAGLRAFPSMLAYCTSKAAVAQITRCAALELAPKGVRVNAVNPGIIGSTRILPNAGFGSEKFNDALMERFKASHPIGRVGTPDEVARSIAFLASDEEASFITGITLSVDGARALS